MRKADGVQISCPERHDLSPCASHYASRYPSRRCASRRCPSRRCASHRCASTVAPPGEHLLGIDGHEGCAVLAILFEALETSVRIDCRRSATEAVACPSGAATAVAEASAAARPTERPSAPDGRSCASARNVRRSCDIVISPRVPQRAQGRASFGNRNFDERCESLSRYS